jgi:hypothetical protein
MKLQDSDLPAIRAACEELGLELRENQKTWKWWGSWANDYHADNAAYRQGIKPEDYGKCEHAIGVPGNQSAYEVGLCRDQDGNLRLAFDFYAGGRGLCDFVGNKGEKLFQTVGKHKAIADCKAAGWQVQGVETTADGKVKITASPAFVTAGVGGRKF